MKTKSDFMHQSFSANPNGTDYFIGDIHGELDLLMQCLGAVSFDKNIDRLFSVGDLIDKGPNSLGVIRLLKEPWFHATLGNHEDLFLNRFYRKTPDGRAQHRYNWGKWADAIENDNSVIEELVELCLSLPLSISVEHSDGKIGIVHAKVYQNDWDSQEVLLTREQECLWHGENYQNHLLGKEVSRIKGVDVVVSGHVNCNEVAVIENQIYIDTLLCTQKLTLISGDELMFIKN